LPIRGEQTSRVMTGSGGRLHFGMVTGIKSERRPSESMAGLPRNSRESVRHRQRAHDIAGRARQGVANCCVTLSPRLLELLRELWRGAGREHRTSMTSWTTAGLPNGLSRAAALGAAESQRHRHFQFDFDCSRGTRAVSKKSRDIIRVTRDRDPMNLSATEPIPPCWSNIWLKRSDRKSRLKVAIWAVHEFSARAIFQRHLHKLQCRSATPPAELGTWFSPRATLGIPDRSSDALAMLG
jgi:hypothetical protein